MRLLHLSDVHFSRVALSPTQFLSKRWLGNLNLAFNRRRHYDTGPLWKIPELSNELKVDHVMLTGDFATTSLEEEFREGARFVDAFTQPVHLLPGNHDCYTREAGLGQVFYRYFPSPGLQRDRITKAALGEGWWWIALDCAHATGFLESNGTFFPEMEERLKKELESIPKEDRVILGNHFPLFSTGRPRHDLVNHEKLQEMIQASPQIKLYLHGHDHTPYHIKRVGFPHVLNAGSCSHLPDGSFYIIDLEEEQLKLTIYQRQAKGGWARQSPPKAFSFDDDI